MLSKMLIERSVPEPTAAWISEAFVSHNPSDSLGACFSDNPDQLSQWRGYADDGYGFMIGFDTGKLSRVGTPGGTGLWSEFFEIKYNEADQRKLLLPMANDLIGFLGEGFNAHIVDFGGRVEDEAFRIPLNENELLRTSYHLILEIFWANKKAIYRMKNPAFREEREWRLLPINPEPTKLFAKRDRLIPYFDAEMYFEPVTSIMLGPKNITPESVVRGCFPGIQDVKRSSATYR